MARAIRALTEKARDRRLTGFLGGDVDGGEEGARARRVERADREEKLRVRRQAAHHHHGLVPRHPDLPHGLRLGVVLPVNHLMETERADWSKNVICV